MNGFVTALHMGQLHAYEQWLVLVVAFGPFLLLGIVVFVLRRRDIAEEECDSPSGDVNSSRPPTT